MIATLTNNYNRRIGVRLKKTLPITLDTSYTERESARTLNISKTGMRIVVRGALCKDEPVTIRLNLGNNQDRSLKIDGRVVWQEKLGAMNTHIVGLTFAEARNARYQICRWIDNELSAA